jgi:hypothetical protein
VFAFNTGVNIATLERRSVPSKRAALVESARQEAPRERPARHEPDAQLLAEGKDLRFDDTLHHRVLRLERGLRNDDAEEAAHLFLAMCSGRYWYRTLVDIRPRVTNADVETYARRVVVGFLRMYGPERSVRQ